MLLRELGGLAYDDVAGALDTTPLAARQAVFAARASLHDQREGRELACALVQRRLSDADRRAARTRAVRAHLRGCDDCRGFAAAIGRRRAAILLPLPPAFASSGLLASILDGTRHDHRELRRRPARERPAHEDDAGGPHHRPGDLGPPRTAAKRRAGSVP